MSVCGDLTEIGGDLANLQNGNFGDAPRELQAFGVGARSRSHSISFKS
jgi:hypothetical protein